MLTFNSCHLAWKSLAPEVLGFLIIGGQRVVPKPIMESLCRTFPTISCFWVCPQYWRYHPSNRFDTVGTGPNTAGGHASVLFNEEVQVCQTQSSLSRRTRHLIRVCQIQHTMQLIKPIITGAVRSFAVCEKASSKYNSWMQKRLARTVWNFCNSYYRRESTNGKIFVTFPGPVSLFWWLARRPRYSDYEIVGGELWKRAQRQRDGIWTALKFIGIMIVVGRVWGGLHHLP